MVSDKVYALLHATQTVSSELAKNPTEPPGKVIARLYGSEGVTKTAALRQPVEPKDVTAEGLRRAEECGNWGPVGRPGELFLRIYSDVLGPLENDPLAGMVSPPFMGSSGVCPLTVISTVPDIVRHMANCIVRAEKEVFFATNFWAYGDTTTLITNALKELSRRAGERGQKMVVKIIYDRGNIKQIFDNHQIVSVAEYTGKAIQLPAPEEIPHIDMQVINYHRPMLGTFHSKYVVVDRKIAILASCNIQETDNLEMMCHFEGPIVDSFYDMALISWHKALEPPLPSLGAPTSAGVVKSSSQAVAQNGASVEHHSQQQTLAERGDTGPRQNMTVRGVENPSKETKRLECLQTGGLHLTNENTPNENGSPLCRCGHEENQRSGESYPGAMPNDWLLEHTTSDPHYDMDIESETRRVNSVVLAGGGESAMQAVTRHLNTTIEPNTKGNVPDCDPIENMTPYILHRLHDPIPIAMVCRRPYGAPNNSSIYTPQNEAWLSGLRNAQKTVFIQSPTMNAEPLFHAIMAACERGVTVTCYLTQGYNDAGELLPGQNGTNEMTSHRLYTTFPSAAKKNLHIHFYIAKDQIRPIAAKFKKRDSHIKLMIIDSHIGIMGNGNQDTQSWFHSQEINVMLDSAQVCREWEKALRRNQNTHLYGEVDAEDGVWRDEEGKEVEGSMGFDPGRFPWMKGIVGAVQRVRGVGGF